MLYVFLLVAVLGVGVLAAASDVRGMTIPNLHSVIVLAAFPVCYGVAWLAGVDVFHGPLSHLLGLLIVFAISAGLFALGVMGAADSKLASAYAVWMGVYGLAPFLFYMTLAGGLLGIATIIMKRYRPFKKLPAGSWMAQAQGGADKVPYGVAIVCGAFVSFWLLGYVEGDVLSAFLAGS
ncbi:MAG: peptidase [Alphaproteobacteria bacterium]|nr:peptidase [Alphaproteobacteria bacterium]